MAAKNEKENDPKQAASSRDNPKEQEGVIARKDHVTKSDRGLQQWGSQEGEGEEHERGMHGRETGQYGDASMGTAERQARIGGLAPGYEPGEGITTPIRRHDDDADTRDQKKAGNVANEDDENEQA